MKKGIHYWALPHTLNLREKMEFAKRLGFEGIELVIVEKGENIEKEADKVIDAKGCFVMPGLIDLHVHFRDPGLTYKEDIITGSMAAANGGFTSVCCMPNNQNLLLTMQKWSDIL